MYPVKPSFSGTHRWQRVALAALTALPTTLAFACASDDAADSSAGAGGATPMGSSGGVNAAAVSASAPAGASSAGSDAPAGPSSPGTSTAGGAAGSDSPTTNGSEPEAQSAPDTTNGTNDAEAGENAAGAADEPSAVNPDTAPLAPEGVAGTGGTAGDSPEGTAGAPGDEMPEGVGGAVPEGQPEESTTSSGCGTEPTLQNSPSTNMYNYNTVMSGGTARRYVLRMPENYDRTRPYQLILGFHGFGNTPANIAGNPAFLGLYELSEGSTIFIAPEAVDQSWSIDTDITFVDDILEQVKADLCIDTARVVVQGFSQGGAMVRELACQRPGVFLAAVAHSAGGIAAPATCEPIPFFGSLGQQESGGGGQLGQTEVFAVAAGCNVETLPAAPTGGHLCTQYEGCAEEYPVMWCPYDGGHTPLPNDAGQNSSWMPEEVWSFLSSL